ncbi:MAG: glutamate--tRNA ligase family protein, partial [Firmicutes bacterium]|nr:glutamate--tRNA ligase family protein [Bacillota bacterium]
MPSPANNQQIRGRFAPSPSGRMHLGNLFAALLAWLDVRKQNGIMIMRLEDLDPDRSHLEYAQLLLDDLHWLGLDWDEGWRGEKDSRYMQSKRGALYESALQHLKQQELIYSCYCSRGERLAASAPHPGEAGTASPCPC